MTARKQQILMRFEMPISLLRQRMRTKEVLLRRGGEKPLAMHTEQNGQSLRLGW